MGDIIVLSVIAIIVGAIVFFGLKNKNNNGCHGCDGCSKSSSCIFNNEGSN